ncbi:MAG: hypothetical protein AB7L09_24705 [Nitrospira sp.]
MNQQNNLIEDQGITDICISSGFGYNTQEPFVQMLIQRADWMTQMSPETARQLAYNLLSAADAAESDGFLVGWLQDAFQVDDMRAIATLLMEFREYRKARRQQ